MKLFDQKYFTAGVSVEIPIVYGKGMELVHNEVEMWMH